jgi:hypothetical protein
MLTRSKRTGYDGFTENVVFTPFSKIHDDAVGDPAYSSFVLPISYPSLYSVEEEASPRLEKLRKTARRTWNSFEHTKYASGSPKFGFSIPIYVADTLWVYRGVMSGAYSAYVQELDRGTIVSDPFGEIGKFDKNLPSFVQSDSEGAFVAPPVDLDNMVSHSLKNMLPYIKEQLSLVNSLIELKDFKSLPGSLRAVDKFTREFFRKFVKDPRATLREGLRVASDGLLQWKFGIGPLVSDLVGIYNSLVNLEKRINALLSRAGTPQKRHYTFRWVEFPNIIDQLEPNLYSVPGMYSDEYDVGPAVGFRMIRNVRYAPSTFHAEVEYNYNYTQYQVEHARILALLDSLGVNINPEIIWNAIPWSFVVDWVLRVGDYLSNFKVSNMEPQINIQRFLWSVHRSRQILVSRGISASLSGDWVTVDVGKQYHLPAVQQTCFKRVVGLPSKSSIESSGLNSNEFTLASALVLSRKRKFNKNRKSLRKPVT